jgi:hypothetical protein
MQKLETSKKKEKEKCVYPDRLKPARATYAKVKDYDKVTASGWI